MSQSLPGADPIHESLPSHVFPRQQGHHVPIRRPRASPCLYDSSSHPARCILILSLVWSVILAGVIPFGIILAWSAMLRPGVQKTQVTVLGLLVALTLTSFLTDLVKNAVGRPRPDLLSRCKPARGTSANVLVSWTVCTQSNQQVLQEGWRSFPSGHSSFSFAGLGYFSL